MSRSSQTTGADIQSNPDLQLRLFGSLSVYVAGAPLPPLRTRKGAWLLALLVLKHQRPVDRIWLAGTLWPDSDPSVSLKNLRNSLTDLRHALGSQQSRLQSPTPTTLHLDLTGAQVDLTAFDAGIQQGDPASLTQAVALYTGSLLDGCEEEWVVLERQQRSIACLEAHETLARFDLQSGAAEQAVQHLRSALALDAFRESTQCALMTALAASGDYAGVTQVYRTFRLQLHEQLHIQPAAETTALYQTIRVRARQVAAGGATPLPLTSLRRLPADLAAAASPQESEGLPADSGPLHNLPPPLTSFIGRETERAEVRGLLAQTRLLTLTGTGGSGKTRLALEVAGELVDAYPAGVWLVELAALSDPARVVSAVASVLAIREQPDAPLMQTLLSTLRSQTLLLLLDNCEHLLGACAELAAALLRGCPGVRLLATSRERLGIGGEQIYRVPSLSLPDLSVGLSVERLQGYESVRLFVARASLMRSDFRVSPQNAGAVALVCHRLDGLPLAIELAAARVRSLSVEDLQRRLEARFDLLTGGDRSALPRQQTLRGLMDWSYDLLNASEKRLLQRLSVFAGGWTLEAAEAVCAGVGCRVSGVEEANSRRIDSKLAAKTSKPTGNATPDTRYPTPDEVLDLLTSLVDKSLVLCEEREGKARYRLLETVHQYARDRLVESGESDRVRRCHRDYFLALSEEVEPRLTSAEQAEWLQRLESEHENLRAALDWSLSEEAGSGEGLRLCRTLQRFWIRRGHFTEGREWCVRALGTAGGEERSQDRAKVLNVVGLLAWMQGDYTSARAYYEESLILKRKIGDRRGIANSLNNLGNVVLYQGDYAPARAYYEESLTIFREIGDRRGTANSLGNLGGVVYFQGDYPSAWAYHEESLTIQREIGDQTGIANSLGNLGDVALNQGDTAAARTYYKESLTIQREIGDPSGIAHSLNNLGNVVYSQGDMTSARAYHEESLIIRRAIGDRGGIASSLNNLGTVAFDQGDYDSARAYQEESLTIRREIGDRNGIASSLEALAGLAANTGKTEQAAVLWGAAEALREEIGAPLPPNEREPYDREVVAARQAQGDEAFITAWSRGRAMTLEEAISLALGGLSL